MTIMEIIDLLIFGLILSIVIGLGYRVMRLRPPPRRRRKDR
jgi:hypothetical protein